jgi:hypothetical protein
MSDSTITTFADNVNTSSSPEAPEARAQALPKEPRETVAGGQKAPYTGVESATPAAKESQDGPGSGTIPQGDYPTLEGPPPVGPERVENGNGLKDDPGANPMEGTGTEAKGGVKELLKEFKYEICFWYLYLTADWEKLFGPILEEKFPTHQALENPELGGGTYHLFRKAQGDPGKTPTSKIDGFKWVVMAESFGSAKIKGLQKDRDLISAYTEKEVYAAIELFWKGEKERAENGLPSLIPESGPVISPSASVISAAPIPPVSSNISVTPPQPRDLPKCFKDPWCNHYNSRDILSGPGKKVYEAQILEMAIYLEVTCEIPTHFLKGKLPCNRFRDPEKLLRTEQKIRADFDWARTFQKVRGHKGKDKRFIKDLDADGKEIVLIPREAPIQLGLLTGEPLRLLAVDCDNQKALDYVKAHLKDTPIIWQNTKKGGHVFIPINDPEIPKGKTDIFEVGKRYQGQGPIMDFRFDKQHAVLGPSAYYKVNEKTLEIEFSPEIRAYGDKTGAPNIAACFGYNASWKEMVKGVAVAAWGDPEGKIGEAAIERLLNNPSNRKSGPGRDPGTLRHDLPHYTAGALTDKEARPLYFVDKGWEIWKDDPDPGKCLVSAKVLTKKNRSECWGKRGDIVYEVPPESKFPDSLEELFIPPASLLSGAPISEEEMTNWLYQLRYFILNTPSQEKAIETLKGLIEEAGNVFDGELALKCIELAADKRFLETGIDSDWNTLDEFWRAARGIPKGDRHDSLAELAGILIAHDVSEELAKECLYKICAKSEPEPGEENALTEFMTAKIDSMVEDFAANDRVKEGRYTNYDEEVARYEKQGNAKEREYYLRMTDPKFSLLFHSVAYTQGDKKIVRRECIREVFPSEGATREGGVPSDFHISRVRLGNISSTAVFKTSFGSIYDSCEVTSDGSEGLGRCIAGLNVIDYYPPEKGGDKMVSLNGETLRPQTGLAINSDAKAFQWEPRQEYMPHQKDSIAIKPQEDIDVNTEGINKSPGVMASSGPWAGRIQRSWEPITHFRLNRDGEMIRERFDSTRLGREISEIVDHCAERFQVATIIPTANFLSMANFVVHGMFRIIEPSKEAVFRSNRDLDQIQNLDSYFTVPISLWSLISSDSGKRKSAVQSIFKKPLTRQGILNSEAVELERKKALRHNKLADKKAETAETESFADPQEYLSSEIARKLLDKAVNKASIWENSKVAIPGTRWLLANNFTQEKLLAQLADQETNSIAFMDSEATQLNILLGKYSQNRPDTTLVCGGYSGDPLESGRVTSGVTRAPQSHIGMMEMLQPHITRGIFSIRSLLDDGFLPRFLPVELPKDQEPFISELSDAALARQAGIIESTDIKECRIDETVLARIEGVVKLLATIKPPKKTEGLNNYYPLAMTEEAGLEYKKAAQEFLDLRSNGGPLEWLAVPLARFPEHIKRVAATIHILKWALRGEGPVGKLIDLETIRSAIYYVNWHLPHIVFLYGQGQQPEEDDIERVFAAITEEGVPKTALSNKFAAEVRNHNDFVNRALEKLEEAGRIKKIKGVPKKTSTPGKKGGKGGRPPILFIRVDS